MIPTLNEADHIADVLGQLRDDGTGQFRYETVVADGGSTDATRQIVADLAARTPGIRLIDNPGRTQAAALNLALGPDFAQTDILIRADAHAAYPPSFVDKLVTALAEKDAASVVIPMDAVAREGCFQKGNAWIADSRLGAGGAAHRGGTRSDYVDHGHHAAFAMESFRALGGYDTGFIANEDAEYDRRLTQSGRRIWLDGGIRISYFPRATVAGLWRQYYRYGAGRAQTCVKHGVRPKLRQMVPVAHVILLALSLGALPFTALGWAWPLAYGAMVGVAGLASAWRHRSPCGLAGSLALATMHLAWGLGFLVSRARAGAGPARAIAPGHSS